MAATSPSAGQVLGHFRLLERIGEGGMGIVFRARDLRLERDVAIKILNQKMLRDPAGRKRFRREALVLGRLNHPNVELVYEFTEDRAIDYLVMEYVPGASLDERLDQGALPEGEVVELGMQLARGLAAAHSRGILHRDLKPGNLRITPERVLKILDFGLAQLFANPDDDTVTQTTGDSFTENAIAGTLPYMAPEQMLGKMPDMRSDVYSAGVVLYEMATGRRPFAERGVALRDAIIGSKPASPRESSPTLSVKLESVILRCLEKDPKARFQSANELFAELAQVAAGRDVADSSAAEVRPRRKRVWASVSAAVLLTAAVGAFLFWRTPNAQAHQRVMAVLPFDEIGQTTATNALGAGLMETVATQLVEAGNDDSVEVVSPHELREKGVKSAADARREFGTDMVLEGSLQQQGDQLRITCNLVDSKTGHQLGARTVTKRVSDIFSLQDEAVRAAVEMLRTAQIQVHKNVSSTRPETTPAAYEAYERGLGYLEEYEKPEKVESAIAAFQNAISFDSSYALAYAALGNAYSLGVRQFSKGKDWITLATASCDKAVTLNSQSVQGHVCRANVFNATGDYQKAIEGFQTAVQSDPHNVPALLGLAEAYTNAGNFAAAEDVYRQAIAARPEYWGVYSKVGAFYWEQSRYSEAATMFRRAIALAPDNYQEYFDLGAVYTYEGHYAQAIDALNRSIQLRPTPDAYGNLGYTYFLMHRFADAVPALEMALKLDDQDWQNWGNLADALYWSKGRKVEAGAAYRRAMMLLKSKLEINPKDAVALAYLGRYEAMLGEEQAALGHIRRGLAAGPAVSEVLFASGVAYSNLNRTDDAIQALQRAVDSGYPRSVVVSTPDFNRLNKNPSFKKLAG
jgi:tetratricopeptide (TPR) repeat protein/TolB-like protein/tRNA A-37 threonylcarbamoyl transferase component Bud32